MIRSIIYNLKANKVLNTILIVSTAISIAFAMVVYMVFILQTGDIGVENKRSRTLFSNSGYSYVKSDHSNRSSGMSDRMAKGIFENLEGVELVCYNRYSPNSKTRYNSTYFGYIGEIGKGGKHVMYKLVHPNHFKMYDYSFVSGRSFTEEENNSANTVMVVTDVLAKDLFGTDDVVGKFVKTENFLDFKIVGVVKQISSFYSYAYSQVFVPANTLRNDYSGKWSPENTRGNNIVSLLVKEGYPLKKVRKQIEKAQERINGELIDYKFEVEVDDIYQRSIDSLGGKVNPLLLLFILVLILLVVPGVNMSGMVSSLIEKRAEEIGVRKTYGATTKEIILLFFKENLIITLCSGILGLLLSMGMILLAKKWLFTSSTGILAQEFMDLPFGTFFHPIVFLMMLLFCFVLNFISVYIPAFHHSKSDIVESLKRR